MIVDVTQRWRGGRESYRPAGEVIRTEEYDVVSMRGKDPRAVAFVEEHHYSHSFPAGRFSFGLYRTGELSGVAVFSVPANAAALTNVFHCRLEDATELGRLVLLDSVPANGETWFLGKAFAELRREGLAGVVSFSDPVPRRTADGRVIHAGHIGTIYQAFNGVYLGRGRARTLRLLQDGLVFNDRTAQKIRGRERGWEGAARTLVEKYGAAPMGDEDPTAWLRYWLGQLTTPLPHPGNHKYAWALHRAVRRLLPPSLPYPKKLGA